VGLGCAAREHSVTFDENLGHIGHHPASVPEGVPLLNPGVDELSIRNILRRRPQVARTENIGFGFDDAVLMRQHPNILDEGQLLHLVDFGVVEDGGGSRSVDGQNRILLVSYFLADDLVLVVGPDRENAAH
jgi:hypothetical protein